MRLTNIRFILALALALSGCSTTQWHRPGGTRADFERDLARCDQIAPPEDNIPHTVPIFSGLRPVLTLGEQDCLRRLDWKP